VLRSGWGDDGRRFADAQHLVFDCGPLGEGNHGHFDCLSFELAAHGRSLVVDPGRYTYSEAGETNWRVHFRGTAAHNTVCVDGRPQTRYAPKAIKEPRHAQGTVRHKIAGPAPEATLLERHHGAPGPAARPRAQPRVRRGARALHRLRRPALLDRRRRPARPDAARLPPELPAGHPVIDHWFHDPSPVATAWHAGDLAFEARWAFWRLDEAGHLLHAVSHDGARLPQWQAQPAEAL
jgi:hypothetical protein